MPSKRTKKPEPISNHIVCSVCGMNWEKHGPEPTLERCVELLKAELKTRPKWQPTVIGTSIGSSFTGYQANH